jgi:hypothetical protein
LDVLPSPRPAGFVVCTLKAWVQGCEDIEFLMENVERVWRRLAIDLNGRSGPYDFSRPLGPINEEIAAIEAGLERLNTALTKSPGNGPG